MKHVTLIDKIIVSMGFKNMTDFITKYILPVGGAVIIMFAVLIYTIGPFSLIIPYTTLIMGLGILIIYPYIVFEQKKMNINENMHLYITFAGSIATLDVQRNILFKKIAERESFGELSTLTKRILYLAKSWNLGFAESCRQVGRINPSKMYSDFLDRFAIMLDFGNSLQRFLGDEQVSVMDDYAVEYKKSLEKIKTIQEIFMALTISLAFLMSIGLLLPLISQEQDADVVPYILGFITFIDIVLVIFIKNFIPNDQLTHLLEQKDDGMKKTERAMYIALPITVCVLVILVFLNVVQFILAVSIAIIPLFIVGILAQNEEELIYSREKAYPSLIRSLGAAIDIRQGGVVSALYSLQVHDFGALNEMCVSLYRRLRTGNPKARCWQLFGAETGSNLIVQFTNIFAEAIFLGGLAEKIGEIVSTNFSKLLSLRKLRIQLTGSLRGALYGAMVGFAVSAYTAAYITSILAGILGSGSGSAASASADALGGIASFNFSFDVEEAVFLISLMIIIHAIAGGIVIKIAEGGYIYAGLFDICILLWLGAIFHYAIPSIIETLLPGMASSFAPIR